MAWQSNKARGRHPLSQSTPGVAPAGADDLAELLRLRQLDADRRRLFHQVVTGESVEIILRGLAKMLELQFPGSRVAAIIPGEGKFFATRPGEDDQSLMETVSIAVAADADSFNQRKDRTAAVWSEVAVSNLETDPIWASQRATCHRMQMGACWTALIPTPRGCPSGTLCLLMPEYRSPTEMETELIRTAAAQAGIALEQHQLGQRLVHQSLHDTITGLPNRSCCRIVSRRRSISGAMASKSAFFSWISTDSSSSTTPSGRPTAMPCFVRLRIGFSARCGAAIHWHSLRETNFSLLPATWMIGAVLPPSRKSSLRCSQRLCHQRPGTVPDRQCRHQPLSHRWT